MYSRKIFLLLFILLLPIISWADTASQELVQILSKVQSLQAQFTQTVLNGQGRILQQTQGKMTLQRPGKFLWQTTKPSKQLLLADGRQVWFFDEDLQQVTVQKQPNDHPNSPAMLLIGSPEKLAQSFLITKQNNTFTLVPKNKNGLFQSVQLTFENEYFANMKLIDNLGQTTNIQFSQVENNPALESNRFQFKIPNGVDVIHT